jgi:hypothetical protein
MSTYEDCRDSIKNCDTSCKVVFTLCIASVILIIGGITLILYSDMPIAGLVLFCIGLSIALTSIFYSLLFCIGACIIRKPVLPVRR